MNSAVSEGIVSRQQADRLWAHLETRDAGRPRFDLPHVAYYLGAMIVISAMGWFMTEAWERFGGGGIFLIAATYGVCFALAGRTLWFNQGLKIPGGLLFTMAVCMVPLAVYGAERFTGLWPQGDPGDYQNYHIWIKGSWLLMEMATIIAALLVLKFVRFPFLTAPIAFSLWYMSMDLTPLLFDRVDFTWNERLWVSLWFGLGMLMLSYLIDRRTRQDYSFWLYIFGMMAFWGGLSLMDSSSELSKFIYCLINLGLMVIAILLERRLFMIFGALGMFGYIGHLAHRVFRDSLLFPFALIFMGIAVIYLGIKYQRNRTAWDQAVLRHIPPGLKRLMPTERMLAKVR